MYMQTGYCASVCANNGSKAGSNTDPVCIQPGTGMVPNRIHFVSEMDPVRIQSGYKTEPEWIRA